MNTSAGVTVAAVKVAPTLTPVRFYLDELTTVSDRHRTNSRTPIPGIVGSCSGVVAS